ncbi:MAG: ABC transporter ATP-binding protein [Elusimicrobiota bacterium]
MNPLLVLEGLEKSFGGTKVLKGISLEVGQGEFLTLLGPSGCGKTTTLRIIAGFEQPDKGRVTLSGSEVTGLAPYRRNVHTVFQHYALFPHYNVFENVAFGLRIKNGLAETEIKDRVLSSLDLVRLRGFENRRPNQLSGGQMQRVALARALAGRPSLLLLDEPLGALDLKLRKEMQFELKHIQKQLGISFIYVTHDQEEAMTMSDRVAVFNAGLIEQIGAPQEIYDRPRTAFVADFLGSANILSAQVLARSDGKLRLRIEDEIEIETQIADAELHPGQAVRMAVRPERIGICEKSSSETSRKDLIEIDGTVADTVYLGNTRQIIIHLFKNGKQIVSSLSPESFGAVRVQSGSRIRIGFKPADAIFLKEGAQ